MAEKIKEKISKMKMNLQLDPTMPKGGSYRRHRKDHFMANSAPAVPTAPVEIAMEGEIISKSEPGNASSIPDKGLFGVGVY